MITGRKETNHIMLALRETLWFLIIFALSAGPANWCKYVQMEVPWWNQSGFFFSN
jgi:hypothetical protein